MEDTSICLSQIEAENPKPGKQNNKVLEQEILVLDGEYTSPLLSVYAYSSIQKTLKLASAEGESSITEPTSGNSVEGNVEGLENSSKTLWQLEVWIPARKQGPTGKHRLISRMTGSFLRTLSFTISGAPFCDNEDEKRFYSFSETLEVKDTKERKIFKFYAPKRHEFRINLEFWCMSMIFPMTFQYALKPAVSARPDSDTLVWLENRLKRIAIDDKMLIAEHFLKEEKRGWPALNRACAFNFDNSLGVAEMRRYSHYKIKAYRLGMIRPFLLLVSMHPKRRVAWANSLEINLAEKLARGQGDRITLGDAHWEAYYIITAQRKGLIDRTCRTFREKFNPLSKTLEWEKILHRVMKEVMSTRSPGIVKIFQKEKMNHEIKTELAKARQQRKDAKKHREHEVAESTDDFLMSAGTVTLENLFTRCIFVSSNEEKIANAIRQHPEVASSVSGIDDLLREAVKIVKGDPELSEKLRIIAKHGFTEEQSAAIAVIFSLKKEVAIVTVSDSPNLNENSGLTSGKTLVYNQHRWTSETEALNEEFRQRVEKRIKRENVRFGVQTIVPLTVVTLISSLGLSHGVVTVMMLSRLGTRAAFPNLPSSVAAIICGIVMQRLWLAISDIGIESYYPTEEELKKYG